MAHHARIFSRTDAVNRLGHRFERPLRASASRFACQLGLIASAIFSTGPAAIAQSSQATLAPVEVRAQGNQPGTEAAGVGGLSIAPLSETPQSISVLDADALRDSGARTLSDAVRLDTSSSDSYNTTGYIESIQVRGLLLDNARNYRRDGLAVSNHVPAAFENRERIEILKGVAGLQAGSASPGGLVNHVLKRPTATDLRRLSVGLSDRGTSHLHADLGGRLAQGQFGYRINLAAAALRPDIEQADGQRRFASAFLDWRLPQGLTLEADFEQARSRQPSVPGLGLFDVDGDGIAETLPAPISPSRNLNAQPWSLPFESRSSVASLRLSQAVNADWLWRLAWQRQHIRTNDRIAFPDGCSSGANYLYPGFCGNGDFDLYDFRSEGERRRFDTIDAHVLGDLKSGQISHELKVGVSLTRYSERFAANQAYNWVGVGNVYAPVILPADPGASTPNTNADSRSREFYAHDAMRIGERWSLWLGLRHTRLERSSLRSDGAEGVVLTQSFTTPWGAVGYKPWDGGFVYLSAGDGIETESVPNQPLAFSNFGQALAALRSRQIEFGLRQQLAHGGLFSATVFQIAKPYSGDVLQGDGRALRVADGREARHRGLELAWAGRMSSQVSGRLAATWLDARIHRSLDPSQQGGRTPNTAPFAATARIVWRVPGMPGLQWGSQLEYSAAKAVLSDRSVELPAYVQFDTDLVYRRRISGTDTTWRAGIDNLFDRRYWRDAPTQYWGGVYLFPARGRTLRVSVDLSF